jgi:hypothetical protein
LAVAGGSALVLLLLGLTAPVSLSTSSGILVLLTVVSFVALTRSGARRGSGAVRGSLQRVAADARGLSVDGELVVPRHAIATARVEDEADGSYTVVVGTHGLGAPRLVRVKSKGAAQALAENLDRSMTTVLEYDALPPWAHRMRWLAMILTTSPWIVFSVLRHLPGAAILFVLGLYGVIALPLLLPQKIAIGDDGVLLKWAGRRRFIPFGAISDARVTSLGVELELRGAPSMEVRLTHRSNAQHQRATAIVNRIHEGMRAHEAVAPADDEALLARGPRDHETWLRDMAALGIADVGYRSIAIPRERLWAVLENPSADPSARKGAALALHSHLDEEERERLVAIAHKSASPRLRVAVDAIATTDAAGLESALLEAEGAEEEEAPQASAPR